jgi:hypothetical protein
MDRLAAGLAAGSGQNRDEDHPVCIVQDIKELAIHRSMIQLKMNELKIIKFSNEQS